MTEYHHTLLTLGVLIGTEIETERFLQVAGWVMEAVGQQTSCQKHSRTTQLNMKPTPLEIQTLILSLTDTMATGEGADQEAGIQDVRVWGSAIRTGHHQADHSAESTTAPAGTVLM